MSGSNPNFVAHEVPTVAQWNGFFTAKVDASNGVADNLTLTGAILAPSIQASTSYASDISAAGGGVAVGQLYRNGSIIQIRQSYVFAPADTVVTSEILTASLAGNFSVAVAVVAATTDNLTSLGRGLPVQTDSATATDSLTILPPDPFSSDFSTDFGSL
jgi:hypothetical protein